jgi:hypothetical protein
MRKYYNERLQEQQDKTTALDQKLPLLDKPPHE